MAAFGRVGILGGGAWGTALGVAAVRAGRTATLWTRRPETARAINEGRSNPDYLPGLTLDPAPAATAEMARALATAGAVLVAVPAQQTRRVLRDASPLWPAGAPCVLCAKGIELETHALLSEVAAQVLGPGVPVAVLSGPAFAAEVVRGLPTAVTIAARDGVLADRLVETLGAGTFRPYSATDVTGVELGGALKNVLAIACGIIAGRGLGENARAAVVARGLAEIARLGLARGARPETFLGLSGVGDLLLTATSATSRNYAHGLRLGTGALPWQDGPLAEGVATAAAAAALGRAAGVDMPLSVAVDEACHGVRPIDRIIENLLARPFRPEADLL